jgi:hypothetical protein
MTSGVVWLVTCSVLAAVGPLVVPKNWVRGNRLIVAICAAFAIPLVGYLRYLGLGYSSFTWTFGYGSLVPIAVAAVSTGCSVFLLLRTRPLPSGGALILACAAACLIWPIAIVGGGLISCGSGDCF